MTVEESTRTVSVPRGMRILLGNPAPDKIRGKSVVELEIRPRLQPQFRNLTDEDSLAAATMLVVRKP